MENIKSNIEDFLTGLPVEKANCIRLISKWADCVYREENPKVRWTFHFDDGAYQGYFVEKMYQSHIDCNAVISLANRIGWSGLKDFSNECKKAVDSVIANKI